MTTTLRASSCGRRPYHPRDDPFYIFKRPNGVCSTASLDTLTDACNLLYKRHRVPQWNVPLRQWNVPLPYWTRSRMLVISCVCALMVCLRSGARCVSVNRGSFAFWPAAWGCSETLICLHVLRSQHSDCRHSTMSAVLASLPTCVLDGLKSQHFSLPPLNYVRCACLSARMRIPCSIRSCTAPFRECAPHVAPHLHDHPDGNARSEDCSTHASDPHPHLCLLKF